jgi:hypothetical protein
MGANKTYEQKRDRGRILDDSDEFRKLHRAIEKAHGDRDQAIRTSAAFTGEDPRRAARRGPGGDVGAARRLRVSTR